MYVIKNRWANATTECVRTVQQRTIHHKSKESIAKEINDDQNKWWWNVKTHIGSCWLNNELDSTMNWQIGTSNVSHRLPTVFTVFNWCVKGKKRKNLYAYRIACSWYTDKRARSLIKQYSIDLAFGPITSVHCNHKKWKWFNDVDKINGRKWKKKQSKQTNPNELQHIYTIETKSIFTFTLCELCVRRTLYAIK